jgi:hypothetical protein
MQTVQLTSSLVHRVTDVKLELHCCICTLSLSVCVQVCLSCVLYADSAVDVIASTSCY